MKSTVCVLVIVLSLLLTSAGLAEPSPDERRGGDASLRLAAPTVTAAVASGRIRFAAPNGVVRLGLEVVSESGQTLFEVMSKGNVLDWTVQDAQGESLIAGRYLCVLTIKDPAGHITQRLGLVDVAPEGGMTVRPAEAAQLNYAQIEAVGPVVSNAALSVAAAGETGETAVLAHTGAEGQLTRSNGPLTFRMGDFFSGQDKEQMRLTEKGFLGIGSDEPEAMLDVAGVVRAREGFAFADGTTLNSTDGRLTVTDARGESVPATTATGTGTLNRLAKWAETDGAGTLTNSSITEVDGRVGFGTTSPVEALHVKGQSLFQETGDNAVFMLDRTDGKIVSFGAGGVSSSIAYDETGIFRIVSNSRANIAQGIFGAGATSRFFINQAGNIGIGTTTPTAQLSLGANNANSKLLLWDDGSPYGMGLGVGPNEFRFHLGLPDNRFTFLDGPAGAPLLSILGSGRIGIGTTSPQFRLDVRGPIRFGFDGELHAVGAVEPLRIVRGWVGGTGVINAGTGFIVSEVILNNGWTEYKITFNTPFISLPVVTATLGSDYGHLISIRSVTTRSCTVRITRTAGSDPAASLPFYFIAVG